MSKSDLTPSIGKVKGTSGEYLRLELSIYYAHGSVLPGVLAIGMCMHVMAGLLNHEELLV